MLKPDVPSYIEFLHAPTPMAWLEAALSNLSLLMIDHAHCERKAAASAIQFLSKYPEKKELITVMSPLAREELLHFEKVLLLLQDRNIRFTSLPPSYYAQKLHAHITTRGTNERLSDQLIVGAIIEARSCERFAALAKVLPDPSLAKFYASLAKAEARHYEDYLRLAFLYGGNIDARISELVEEENTLIHLKEEDFRFHSGIPADSPCLAETISTR